MTDTKTTLTWLLRDQVSGPARKMEGALGAAEKRAGTSGGVFAKLGGVLGGLVNPTTLAIGGIGAVTAGLAYSIKAAADEQKNIEKLGASLKANVPNWNGNTDAIEALIKKRENLAFSDDELRNSLALLVASTHDVNAAQNLQATAMDLARLKGVDLETATVALAKANAGSTRELKALGITVDDTKDKTQIFAAIQKAAAGQAEAYAGTSSAKWETFMIKVQDVAEDIGKLLLPVMDALVTFLNDAVVPAIEAVVRAISTLIGWIKDAIGFFHDLFDSDKKTQGLVAGGGGHNRYLPPRAAGGPVEAGGAYLVGERGPEMLVMGNRAGTVVPNGSLGSMAPVEIPIIVDGREIARVSDRRLYLQALTSGSSLARS